MQSEARMEPPMTSPVLDVTLTGRLVHCGPNGEAPLTASEFTHILDKIADCLHGEIDDACVSGQASTGEVEMWFLVPNAPRRSPLSS